MNTSAIAVECLDFVQWQGVHPYVTKRGKEKEILVGIPSEMFWRRWHAHQVELRAAYFTPFRFQGCKEWAAVIWLNRYTLPVLTMRGLVPVGKADPIESPELETSENPY